MEICRLSVRVNQDELNSWLRQALANVSNPRELSIDLTPAGPVIRGEYYVDQFGVKWWLPFEADVEPGVSGGLVGLRLTDIRIRAKTLIPLPASFIVSKLAARLAKLDKEWLFMEGDTVILNLERLLEQHGVSLQANLTHVRCEAGALFLESEAPPAKS
ncbi:MAG: hypothetical protein QHJ73_15800 [Armatimonadota bacterium]|nr:hypothetical protein [Armatimonadota bacterium]